MAPNLYTAAALISLLSITKTVSELLPTCSHLYGSPSSADCAWLVNQLQHGWPNSDIVNDHYFYALRGTPQPAEISDDQYKTFFEVPRVVQHGSCMMSLSPMVYSQGVTWDTGTFAAMRAPSLKIIGICSGTYTTIKEGGHIEVGGNLRLILTLFGPNSHMDQVFKTIHIINADMCARVASNAAVAGSDVGGYQDCSQPLDDDEFYDFLDQAFHTQANTPNTHLNPAPKCGDPCYGQINLCTGSDRCRCIADPLQGPGIARFRGTCTSSYFSYVSYGRRLLTEGPPNSSTSDVILVEGTPSTVTNVNMSAVGLEQFAADNASSLTSVAASPALTGPLRAASCPCNCTYVSVQCCLADSSGIVHETPEKKLGILEPPLGLCCDDVTGVFKGGLDTAMRQSVLDL